MSFLPLLIHCFSVMNVRSCIVRMEAVGRSRGVLITVADGIISWIISFPADLEMTGVSATYNFKPVSLGMCYHPPSLASTFVNELHNVLNTLVNRFPECPMLLVGDFNYLNIIGSDVMCQTIQSPVQFNIFVHMRHDFSLYQLVHCPIEITSTSANISDLVLMSEPELVTDLSRIHGISNHSAIHFFINNPIQKHVTKKSPSGITAKLTSQILTMRPMSFCICHGFLFLPCWM